MNKDLSEQLIQLDIRDLIGCLQQPSIKPKFDTFVKKTIDERRKNSSVIGMREFHNWIKRTLIQRLKALFKGDVSLLDIAVGRGGDIDKWNKAGIKYVYGFDISNEFINGINPLDPGANERKRNYRSLNTVIEFDVGNAATDDTQLKERIVSFEKKNKIKGFHLISCQFALHYFFKSEDALRNVFKTIRQFLRPGGFFFGTTIDGRRLNELFKPSRDREYAEELFVTQRNYNKTSKDIYGKMYLFQINDIYDNSNYFNSSGVSEEYLVDFNELIRIAEIYGLEPVYKYDMEIFKAIQGNVKVHDFLSFEEIHQYNIWTPKSGKGMNPNEISLNNLYTTFIFRKK